MGDVTLFAASIWSEKGPRLPIIDTHPFFESAGREEREMREDDDWGGEGSPPLRDNKKMTTTIFWGDDEGPVVMVGQRR